MAYIHIISICNLYYLIFFFQQNLGSNFPAFIVGGKNIGHFFLAKMQNTTFKFDQNSFQTFNFTFIQLNPLTFNFIQLRIFITFCPNYSVNLDYFFFN